MDGVMTGVTILHQQTMALMQLKVSKVLCDNVPEEVISATNAIFENTQSPFVNPQTEYKQNQYFKNFLSLIVSYSKMFTLNYTNM